jgi:hypothetical protein
MKQSVLESFFEPSRRSDGDAPLVQRKTASPAIGRAYHALADDSGQCVHDATAVPPPCDIESDDDAPLVQRRSKESATGHALNAEAVESHDRIDEVPPPSVVRYRARYTVTSASDRNAKRSKYEAEAEECSDFDDEDDRDADDSFIDDEEPEDCSDCDDEDGSDADNSFIVSDHGSNADGADLRAICGSLRNRREFVMNNIQCPQCYRLIAAILRFVADVHVAVPR